MSSCVFPQSLELDRAHGALRSRGLPAAWLRPSPRSMMPPRAAATLIVAEERDRDDAEFEGTADRDRQAWFSPYHAA